MPRKPRSLSSTGIYHIILRSVNQHIIFEDEFDYHKFLFLLSDCKNKYEIDIFAYCLMDNHIHLLIHAQPDKLAGFFQSLGSTFARWYNSKYSRSGHLFQERFHSVVIHNDSQYLSTLSYIHNNPTQANICRFPSEYRWSSYNAFYGQNDSLVNTSFSCEVAGSRENLIRYFASRDDSCDEELYEKDHPAVKHYLTDEQAIAVFKSVTGFSEISETASLCKKERNNTIRLLRRHKLLPRQIARIMDVSLSTVKRICKK